MPIIRDEKKRTEIISMLTRAYWMEIETGMIYIANSVNLDGVRAEEIKNSLATDITGEIRDAQRFGRRIKGLDGKVAGRLWFKAAQDSRQPSWAMTDVVMRVQ